MAVICVVVAKMLAKHHLTQQTQQQHHMPQQAAAPQSSPELAMTTREVEVETLVILPGENQPRVLARPCSILEDEGLPPESEKV